VGDGSILRFKGAVKYYNFIFNGEANDPLVFMLTKQYGFVYISGKGMVTSPEGQVTQLPDGTPTR
jgi:hypothetical protein